MKRLGALCVLCGKGDLIGLETSNCLPSLPVGEALGEGIENVGEFDAGAEELGRIEDAIGTRGLGGYPIEFLVVGPELEVARGGEVFLDQVDDLAGADESGVGDVVGAEGDAQFPAFDAGAGEVDAVGDRVEVFVDARVELDLGEIVPRVVDVVERDAQAPDVPIAAVLEGFLTEGLGAAVEAAWTVAEAEVGCIVFGEADDPVRVLRGEGAKGGLAQVLDCEHGAVVLADVGPGVDASGGDVSPWNFEGGASLGNGLREDNVAQKCSGAIEFAGVYVGLACVTGSVEDEGGLEFAEPPDERIERPGIQFTAAGCEDAVPTDGQLVLEGGADIALGSEEQDALRLWVIHRFGRASG